MMKKLLLTAIVAMAAMALPAQQQQQRPKPVLEPALEQKWEAYVKEVEAFDAQLADLERQAAADSTKLPQLRQQAMDIYDKKTERMWQIVVDNPDNLIPTTFLRELAYSLEYEELKQICNPAHAYYNDPAMDLPKRLLADIEKKAPGNQFIDMTLADLDGKQRKLSEWCGQGNYVLIDFWASWCGPCRQEMPNVVQNYKKYHSAGFEIVGISFDSKADAWRQAVAQMGMDWPQLSDLKGWKAAAVDTYGIHSIPQSVLVGKDGKIVALNLRGEALGQKLAELYGF